MGLQFQFCVVGPTQGVNADGSETAASVSDLESEACVSLCVSVWLCLLERVFLKT